MTVLVCGGRSFADVLYLYHVLDALPVRPTLIITGGAGGADSLARQWAHSRSIECLSEMADWHAYGKAAGPMRNQRMLDLYHPQLVVAFEGGAGTMDMTRKARAAGVEVLEA